MRAKSGPAIGPVVGTSPASSQVSSVQRERLEKQRYDIWKEQDRGLHGKLMTKLARELVGKKGLLITEGSHVALLMYLCAHTVAGYNRHLGAVGWSDGSREHLHKAIGVSEETYWRAMKVLLEKRIVSYKPTACYSDEGGEDDSDNDQMHRSKVAVRGYSSALIKVSPFHFDMKRRPPAKDKVDEQFGQLTSFGARLIQQQVKLKTRHPRLRILAVMMASTVIHQGPSGGLYWLRAPKRALSPLAGVGSIAYEEAMTYLLRRGSAGPILYKNQQSRALFTVNPLIFSRGFAAKDDKILNEMVEAECKRKPSKERIIDLAAFPLET